MNLSSSRSLGAALIFFVVLGGMCFTFYRWVKGPTIRADEVRVYRLLPSGKPSLQTVVRLQGDAAQQAANNFVFSFDGTYFECLDSNSWFRVVFIDKNRSRKSFDLYLHKGQIQPENGSDSVGHLSSSSRDYWEKLIQNPH